nr:MAG: hypothetical protein [Bacteriophage sp.]
MKEEIELFLNKVAKLIKGKNYLYCVCKKGYHHGFIESIMRIQPKKKDSLIFVRYGDRFIFRDEFEGMKFKGVLIYGSLSKLIKERLNMYSIPEFKRTVYVKEEAFVLATEYVDNKKTFSFFKNGIELDLKIFLETGEEKRKTKK